MSFTDEAFSLAAWGKERVTEELYVCLCAKKSVLVLPLKIWKKCDRYEQISVKAHFPHSPRLANSH